MKDGSGVCRSVEGKTLMNSKSEAGGENVLRVGE